MLFMQRILYSSLFSSHERPQISGTLRQTKSSLRQKRSLVAVFHPEAHSWGPRKLEDAEAPPWSERIHPTRTPLPFARAATGIMERNFGDRSLVHYHHVNPHPQIKKNNTRWYFCLLLIRPCCSTDSASFQAPCPKHGAGCLACPRTPSRFPSAGR